MRNDQQNQGNKPKQQTQGGQEKERGTIKQGARALDKEGKEGKSRKGRALDEDRNPGRTTH